jgi:Flp pilus assembly protein TadB
MKSISWPLERVLFALAGTVVTVAAILAAVASPWFLLLVVFVGASQWLYVVAGWCPASVLLERFAGVERGCGR